VYAHVNLDFHGIGKDSVLDANPLRYNLEPKGGMANVRYRLGDTLLWVGLGYTFASTRVSFEVPASTPRLPDYEEVSNIGGLTLAATYDTRNNFFTATHGIYAEASFNPYGSALGGDDTFERAAITTIQYAPLARGLYLGVRDDLLASFGDAPFYMNPYVGLRGVPVMRYQGQEVAQLEMELRWQFYGRLSLVGFTGGGIAWNDFEKVDNSQAVVSGGGGFRYELARRYGIHMGVDVAFSHDTTAFYIQVGSAWMRP
jgi:outer membrane protein assembly factor BamA